MPGTGISGPGEDVPRCHCLFAVILSGAQRSRRISDQSKKNQRCFAELSMTVVGVAIFFIRPRAPQFHAAFFPVILSGAQRSRRISDYFLRFSAQKESEMLRRAQHDSRRIATA